MPRKKEMDEHQHPPTFDPPYDDEGRQMMLREMESLANDRPATPRPMEFVAPQDLIADMYEKRIMFSSMGMAMMRKAWLGLAMHRSTTPLSELSPIRLRKMKRNQRQMVCSPNPLDEYVPDLEQGKYLLCRIIALPHHSPFTFIAVEDQNGWADTVFLHNFPYAECINNEELDMTFPVNTVVAIREPYHKSGYISVLSPSDIVFLEPGDPIISGASWKTGARPFPQTTRNGAGWKVIGNRHFRAHEYFAAIIAYTFGIRQDPGFIDLRLNRALSYLRLSNFPAVIGETTDILKQPTLKKDSKIKALYRAGQAAYGLGDYQGAIQYYQGCLTEDPNLQDAKAGIGKCNQRIKEKETGDYDWVSLVNQAAVPSSRIDIADYTGPIQVVPMENRGGGRGVVATRDIKTGELLLVSKALIAAYREDYDPGITFQVFHCRKRNQDKSMLYSAMRNVVNKIYATPPLAAQVLDLYAGNRFQGTPLPPLNYTELDYYSNPLAFHMDIDIARIEEILDLNSPNTIDIDKKHSPVFLFILLSYLNHSCACNTFTAYYGDIVTVRAIQDIPKGEEITREYAFEPSYSRRMFLLSKYFDQCNCEICEADRAEVPKLDRLVEDAKTIPTKEFTVSMARDLVQKMQNMYRPSRECIRPGLAFAYQQLASALPEFCGTTQAELKKSQKDQIKARIGFLEASGLTVIDKGMHDFSSDSSSDKTTQTTAKLPISPQNIFKWPDNCSKQCVSIATNFLCLGLHSRAKMWLQASLWIENIAYGGGIRRYKATHSLEAFPIGMLEHLEEL